MRADFPAVDDHVVESETGTEMIDGEIRRVMPAHPPHAREQTRIAAVISANVASGYAAATELLTRVDHDNDFATDACIYKLGRDPETGSRYLEELSFEVKYSQSNADITSRARKLVRRGVRRVFAIHVGEDEDGELRAGPVKEWMAAENRWRELPSDEDITDRCLMQPIKVQALLDATEAKNQAARALLAEGNAVIAAAQQKAVQTREQELVAAHQREMQARDERERETLRAMIVRLCSVLGIEVTAGRRALLDAMTRDELDALCSALSEQRCWPERL